MLGYFLFLQKYFGTRGWDDLVPSIAYAAITMGVLLGLPYHDPGSLTPEPFWISAAHATGVIGGFVLALIIKHLMRSDSRHANKG